MRIDNIRFFHFFTFPHEIAFGVSVISAPMIALGVAISYGVGKFGVEYRSSVQ